MKTKQMLLAIILLITGLPALFATHYMGGEITWECLSNGKFRFKLVYYRECYTSGGGSAANYATSYILNSNSPAGNITLTRILTADISPICNSNTAYPHIICPVSGPGMPNGAANMGAIQKHVYTSDNTYPNGVQLSGVPPATGWIFSLGGCCRNPSTNIVNAALLGWSLRTVMYPYNNQNTYPCFDSSPDFINEPPVVMCIGYDMKYNYVTVDPDNDSLSFEWGQPKNDNQNPITSFAAGYSYSSPLPGTTQNPNNIPATVDPYSGEVSYLSNTQGAFVTNFNVTSYRCGVKIAETQREIEVVLLACGTNVPPAPTPPFINPITGLYTDFIDTVYAGQFITFPMSGTDFGFLPPPGNIPQTITMEALSPHFGTNYSSTTTGCLNSPCATLTPSALPISGQFGVQATFNWQTDCNHLTSQGCVSNSNIYNFVLRLTDDYCPAPAFTAATVTIVVISPHLQSPDIKCLNVLPNGDVAINWLPIIDTLNTFVNYSIYKSDSLIGGYYLLDTIPNILQSTYTHINAGADTIPSYYLIKTKSGCDANTLSVSQDTIYTMYLSAASSGSGIIELNWNTVSNKQWLSSTGWYKIFKQINNGGYSLLDSVQSTTYSDTILANGLTVDYYIELTDTSSCSSRSNIATKIIDQCVSGYFHVQDTFQPLLIHFTDTSGSNITNYHWTFGDNTYSNLQNPVHYYANTGSYQVCLEVTDTNTYNCVDITCKQISINTGPVYNISGQVFALSNPIDIGIAYLYAQNTASIIAVDTFDIDTLGAFYFHQIALGNYIIKADLKPASIMYNQYFPTYYGDELNWINADTLVLNQNLNNININLIPIAIPGPGPGNITGNIYNSSNKGDNKGSVIKGASIFLKDNNNPLILDYSDDYGHFGFNNIAYGTYIIYPEITGKNTIPAIVVLDANNPSQDIIYITNDTAVFTSVEFFNNKLEYNVSEIYPDPVKNNAMIDIILTKPSSVEIIMFDAIGQLYFQKNLGFEQGINKLEVPVSNLPAGLYYLKIFLNREDEIHRKFIRLK
ncbi:PKD domain-containing protein [Bacteroidota bacterium]